MLLIFFMQSPCFYHFIYPDKIFIWNLIYTFILSSSAQLIVHNQRHYFSIFGCQDIKGAAQRAGIHHIQPDMRGG
ncbi:hypothetical protein EV682_101497 [Iodobacter fluviatilis]|uniref:Uncharacterized protein n=1 Tax=Iodobacter fluviatilis TaxID=537 RepID=A0A377Q6N3_9NEIS|nr:hypothetical protein EV682_101497 [Iodobacter fluviatilis]STQ89491.1 Uncharacterised protein [Iodobacter fluviatilis]